eukprot:jgi/Antlo1/1/2021
MGTKPHKQRRGHDTAYGKVLAVDATGVQNMFLGMCLQSSSLGLVKVEWNGDDLT